MMERKQIDWPTAFFLIGYQLAVIIALPFYFYFYRPSGALIAISATMLAVLGITLSSGYHRYFSHKSYKAHPIVESVLLFLSPLLVQESALRWSFDHRRHHAFVDTDKDPYSIKKGFWYAHFTWMLYKGEPIDLKVVKDLWNNPRVRFQHRHRHLLMFGSNILVGLIIGYLLNDYVGAFMIAVGLRLLLSHHMTWFINSLAHTWGDRPFCQEQTAVNNFILALLTWGEGYHNYHHVFAKDYRNGVRWFHWDPTKWLVYGLSKIGLTSNLRKMDDETVKKMMVIKRKKLLLERICLLAHDRQEALKQEVIQLSEKLLENLELKSYWRQWNHLSQKIFNSPSMLPVT